MKKLISKGKEFQKGYALLFAILIISAISVVTAGLINTVYKQLILSLLAKDSSSAFYQADTAMDCGMYADLANKLDGDTLDCGGFDLQINKLDNGDYDLLPPENDSNDPCFRISIDKNEITGDFDTKEIRARGYNICDMTNPKTVEREIVIRFEE